MNDAFSVARAYKNRRNTFRLKSSRNGLPSSRNMSLESSAIECFLLTAVIKTQQLSQRWKAKAEAKGCRQPFFVCRRSLLIERG